MAQYDTLIFLVDSSSGGYKKMQFSKARGRGGEKHLNWSLSIFSSNISQKRFLDALNARIRLWNFGLAQNQCLYQNMSWSAPSPVFFCFPLWQWNSLASNISLGIRFHFDCLSKLFIINIRSIIIQGVRCPFQCPCFTVVEALGQHLGRVIVIDIVAIQGARIEIFRCGWGAHIETGLSFHFRSYIVDLKKRQKLKISSGSRKKKRNSEKTYIFGG